MKALLVFIIFLAIGGCGKDNASDSVVTLQTAVEDSLGRAALRIPFVSQFSSILPSGELCSVPESSLMAFTEYPEIDSGESVRISGARMDLMGATAATQGGAISAGLVEIPATRMVVKKGKSRRFGLMGVGSKAGCNAAPVWVPMIGLSPIQDVSLDEMEVSIPFYVSSNAFNMGVTADTTPTGFDLALTDSTKSLGESHFVELKIKLAVENGTLGSSPLLRMKLFQKSSPEHAIPYPNPAELSTMLTTLTTPVTQSIFAYPLLPYYSYQLDFYAEASPEPIKFGESEFKLNLCRVQTFECTLSNPCTISATPNCQVKGCRLLQATHCP